MRRLQLLSLLLLVTTIAFAGKVSEQQAYSIALEFASSHGMTVQAAKPRLVAKKMAQAKQSDAAYYVFNMGGSNGGFVIVSGDDRTEQILGYSSTGSYDAANIPDGLKWMLETYAANIAALGDSAPQAKPRKVSGQAVAPLVKTHWNQDAPYNLLCPQKNGEYCYTGCVATAMAQIMYYHRYPTRATAEIPSYSSYDALPATTFNWELMKEDYDGTETDASAMEVAKLMEYCGHSVKMSYGTSGSYAYDSDIDLAKYFGYSSIIKTAQRSNYDDESWNNLVYSELAAGRPVYYSGRDGEGSSLFPSKGHAFVCDGYDGDGYFHINWGWGGLCDGYYVLSMLEPAEEGIGGNGGVYSYSQSIIYNIKAPSAADSSEAFVDITDISSADTLVTRSSSSDAFTATVKAKLVNTVSNAGAYTGVALYDTNGLKKTLKDNYSINTGTVSYYLDFSGIEDGTYVLKVICRNQGGNYVPCNGSDEHYLNVTISGDTMRLSAVNPAPIVSDAVMSVSNVAFDGTAREGHDATLGFDITNTGTTDGELPLKVYVGSKTSSLGVYVKAGATTHRTLNFTLPENSGGKVAVTIEKVKTKSTWETLYSDSLAVEEVPQTRIYAWTSVSAWDNDGAAGKSIVVSVDLLNENPDNDYNDDIIATLYNSMNNSTVDNPQTKTLPAVIARGATGTTHLEFVFDSLDMSKKYYNLYIHYYGKGGSRYIIYESGHFSTDSVLAPPVLEAAKTDLGSLTYPPTTMPVTITNKGKTAFNGKLHLQLRYFNEYNYYGQTGNQDDSVAVNIPAGGSVTIDPRGYVNSKLDKSGKPGKYLLAIYYKNDQQAKYNYNLFNDEGILYGAVSFTFEQGKVQKIEAGRIGELSYTPKTLSVTYRNTGENDYDDYIIYNIRTAQYVYVFADTTKVQIAKGDSLTLTYDLPDIKEIGDYYGGAEYYTYNEDYGSRVTKDADGWMAFRIKAFQGLVDNAQWTKSGNVLNLAATLTIANNGDTEYNDTIELYHMPKGASGYIDWGYYHVDTVVVRVSGHDETIVPITVAGLPTDLTAYEIDVYYRKDGKFSWLTRTTFDVPDLPDTPTGIRDVELEGTSTVLKVYDLSGRYIGEFQKSELKNRLHKGIYIIDGKKFIIR